MPFSFFFIFPTLLESIDKYKKTKKIHWNKEITKKKTEITQFFFEKYKELEVGRYIQLISLPQDSNKRRCSVRTYFVQLWIGKKRLLPITTVQMYDNNI